MAIDNTYIAASARFSNTLCYLRNLPKLPYIFCDATSFRGTITKSIDQNFVQHAASNTEIQDNNPSHDCTSPTELKNHRIPIKATSISFFKGEKENVESHGTFGLPGQEQILKLMSKLDYPIHTAQAQYKCKRMQRRASRYSFSTEKAKISTKIDQRIAFSVSHFLDPFDPLHQVARFPTEDDRQLEIEKHKFFSQCLKRQQMHRRKHGILGRLIGKKNDIHRAKRERMIHWDKWQQKLSASKVKIGSLNLQEKRTVLIMRLKAQKELLGIKEYCILDEVIDNKRWDIIDKEIFKAERIDKLTDE